MNATILSRLEVLTEEERAHAYVQANCWTWPDALSDLKPSDWDEQGNDRFQKGVGKELWSALFELTTDFARSRQWWRETMNRTDAEHAEWWASYRQNGMISYRDSFSGNNPNAK